MQPLVWVATGLNVRSPWYGLQWTYNKQPPVRVATEIKLKLKDIS